MFDIVKLSYWTCQQILSHELNMRHITAKFVHWLLSNDQKEEPRCRVLCLRNRRKMTPTSSLPLVLVMNLGFTDTTLRRSSNHLNRRRQIHRDRRTKGKFQTMSNQCWFFFGIEGTVHKEFVPPGQTVNRISVAMFRSDWGRPSDQVAQRFLGPAPWPVISHILFVGVASDFDKNHSHPHHAHQTSFTAMCPYFWKWN